ncbi:cupin domain-containing protein [Candidatus Dojkabacteria bacterium]|nr:cupin domain-containing protein [Candidatus Dojkabacteria bacterium]
MKVVRNKKWISGESYKKRILLDQIKGKINLIEDVVVEPRGVIPSHSHDFTDEIFYVTENSAIMIVNGKEFQVNPGDMIYVERDEEHGFRNDSDKEFKMIVSKVNYKDGDSYLK